jgi:receptor expression-enhancing protein 5/6
MQRPQKLDEESVLIIQLNKYPILRDLETRTKVPKAYGVLGLGVSYVS